jgi:hypothetical protein
VLSSVLEVDPRSGDKITHSAGDENLTGFGSRSNSCPDVYGDASHVRATELDLTTVQSCSDLDTQWTQCIPDRLRAPDRSPRSIEGGQKAIAG